MRWESALGETSFLGSLGIDVEGHVITTPKISPTPIHYINIFQQHRGFYRYARLTRPLIAIDTAGPAAQVMG